MIRNTRDKSSAAPRLRLSLNSGNLHELPDDQVHPRGTAEEIYRAVKDAGYEAIQGPEDESAARRVGLAITSGNRVDTVGDADRVAREAKDKGYDCVTLHVGTGFDDDDVVFKLLDAILNASARHDLPLYVETHRATITQDIWRTLQFIKKFPGLRLNGDFSHWYTGHEMVYAPIEKKWELMAPAFERVRFIHGRIGNPGCIQVDIGDGTNRTYVDHFREMWTRSFEGFLRTAKPGDFIDFTPELLWPAIYYARTYKDSRGRDVEEGNRWEQALLLTRIATECFAVAERRVGAIA